MNCASRSWCRMSSRRTSAMILICFLRILRRFVSFKRPLLARTRACLRKEMCSVHSDHASSQSWHCGTLPFNTLSPTTSDAASEINSATVGSEAASPAGLSPASGRLVAPAAANGRSMTSGPAYNNRGGNCCKQCCDAITVAR